MMVRCAIGDLLCSSIPNPSTSLACLRSLPMRAKQPKSLRPRSLAVVIDSRSMLIALISLRASKSTSMLDQKTLTFISAIRGKEVPCKGHTNITMRQSHQSTFIQVSARVRSTERWLNCSSQVPWTGQSNSGRPTLAKSPCLRLRAHKSMCMTPDGVQLTQVCLHPATLKVSSIFGTSMRTQKFRLPASKYLSVIAR